MFTLRDVEKQKELINGLAADIVRVGKIEPGIISVYTTRRLIQMCIELDLIKPGEENMMHEMLCISLTALVQASWELLMIAKKEEENANIESVADKGDGTVH